MLSKLRIGIFKQARAAGQSDRGSSRESELVPIDLSPSTGLNHLLIRLQRAENFTLNSPTLPTAFGVSLRLADGSHGPYVPVTDYIPEASPLLGPVGGPANSRNNFCECRLCLSATNASLSSPLLSRQID